MKSTKWIKIFFGLSLIGVLFVGGVNYIVDPLWMFDHSNKFNQKQDGFDERQQKQTIFILNHKEILTEYFLEVVEQHL